MHRASNRTGTLSAATSAAISVEQLSACHLGFPAEMRSLLLHLSPKHFDRLLDLPVMPAREIRRRVIHEDIRLHAEILHVLAADGLDARSRRPDLRTVQQP